MKLLPFSVYVLGAVLGFVLLSVGYFNFWEVKTTEAQYWTEHGDKLETEANKLPAMQRKVKEAVAFANTQSDEWQAVVDAKTPSTNPRTGGIDLSRNRYQLVVDSIYFRNRIQAAVNRQLRSGGVKVISAPRIEDFPSDPATIVEAGFGLGQRPFPVRIYNLGRITVEGTRQQIEANMQNWTNMPDFMAVADGLVYEGTSPTLRGSYSLSVVMFIQGRTVSPPAPVNPGAATAAPGAPAGGIVPGGERGARAF